MKQILKGGSIAVLASLVLAACGGGGGGGGSTTSTTTSTNTSNNSSGTTTASAEGVYQGALSSGKGFQTLVLENGQFYGLYGVNSGGVLYVSGIVQGTGSSNNGSFTSSNLRDYYASGQVVPGTLSASYVPGTSLNGSVTESGNGTVTFTGSVPQSSGYVYNAAANLADITGSWTMTTLQGESVALTIQSSGTFSATSSGGCSFSGTVTPRTSGKNVFNVSLQFGASPCVLAGQTASGIAVDFITTTGTRELIFAGTDSAQAHGTAIFGTR